VHPESDKVVRLLDGLWLGVQQTLEHISQVTNVELVVEVGSGLSETSHDILVQQ